MSKYLEHSENIASYLDGDMSLDQMQEFEKLLHTDPVLRSEFELQQDIMHTLQDFRKTQLKTRLDQVPVRRCIARTAIRRCTTTRWSTWATPKAPPKSESRPRG